MFSFHSLFYFPFLCCCCWLNNQDDKMFYMCQGLNGYLYSSVSFLMDSMKNMDAIRLLLSGLSLVSVYWENKLKSTQCTQKMSEKKKNGKKSNQIEYLFSSCFWMRKNEGKKSFIFVFSVPFIRSFESMNQ